MNTMGGALQQVSYGPGLPPPGEAVAASPLGFDATLGRLKEAMTANDLWLIHEINPQALLLRVGYDMEPARQLLFFHPRYVTRLLAANPAALIEVPLKVAVVQMPDGRVSVRHVDVEAVLSRYPGMSVLAAELAGVMRDVVGSLQSAPAKRMG